MNLEVLTAEMTPRESVSLARRLERAHRKAWAASADAARRRVPEAGAAFETAAMVDEIFRDVLWDQIELGYRKPAETLDAMLTRIARERRAAVPLSA